MRPWESDGVGIQRPLVNVESAAIPRLSPHPSDGDLGPVADFSGTRSSQL